MSSLDRALEIAIAAHADRFDAAGKPYVFRSIQVMNRVPEESQKIAAALHDAVEDATITLEQLEREGFPHQVLQAIDALTKRPGETRLEAALRAAANPIARAVKLADNAENMDLSRIPNPTEQDQARCREYAQVRALLLAAENI